MSLYLVMQGSRWPERPLFSGRLAFYGKVQISWEGLGLDLCLWPCTSYVLLDLCKHWSVHAPFRQTRLTFPISIKAYFLYWQRPDIATLSTQWKSQETASLSPNAVSRWKNACPLAAEIQSMKATRSGQQSKWQPSSHPPSVSDGCQGSGADFHPAPFDCPSTTVIKMLPFLFSLKGFLSFVSKRMKLYMRTTDINCISTHQEDIKVITSTILSAQKGQWQLLPVMGNTAEAPTVPSPRRTLAVHLDNAQMRAQVFLMGCHAGNLAIGSWIIW